MEDEYLCFVKYIGQDIDSNNIYEFLFSDKIDEFWGESFEYFPACVATELIPNEDYYNVVKEVKTKVKLVLAQSSCCNSFQDCIDHIIPVAYEDISEYTDYPDLRLVLPFGLSYEETEELLSQKDILMETKEKEEV